MIPAQNIIAWSQQAPWAKQRQVEQDLIISRALVELFGDPFLAQELRFRGGTALNKLLFSRPLRYFEDIDLVRTTSGPIRPILDRLHDVLDPWLGKPKFDQSPVAPGHAPARCGNGSDYRLRPESTAISTRACGSASARLGEQRAQESLYRRGYDAVPSAVSKRFDHFISYVDEGRVNQGSEGVYTEVQHSSAVRE